MGKIRAGLLALATLAMTALGVATPLHNASAETTANSRIMKVTGDIATITGEPAQSRTITIPDGFIATAIRGTLTPGKLGEGTGSVLVGDGRRAVTLPNDRVHNFEAPLYDFDFKSGNLILALQSVFPNTSTQVCTSPEDSLLVLSNIELVLEGVQQPITNVGDFFASSISEVVIITPDDASDGLKQAALVATGAVAMKYALPVQVRLLSESDYAITDPVDTIFGRVIRVIEKEQFVTTELVNIEGFAPELVVTGRSDEVTSAVRGLSSQFLGIANDTSVEGPFAEINHNVEMTRSLQELGRETIYLKGYGRAEAAITIPQSLFGGPVDKFKLHLSGTHSSVGDSIQATMQIYWNGQLIASQHLTKEDSNVDFDLDISSEYINAENYMVLQLNSVPASGNCTGGSAVIPFEMNINGIASNISAERGQGLPAGFKRFPQSFGGALQMAFGSEGAPDDLLSAAGTLIVALQRLNTYQLDIKVVSMNTMLESTVPAIVVGATSEDARLLQTPLRFSEFKAISDENGDFAVGVTKPFAALQAFENNGRDILVLGGYSPDAAESAQVTSDLQVLIARSIAESEFGWLELFGDLYIATDLNKEPRIFESNYLVPQPEITAEYTEYVWWALIVLGAIALLLLIRLLFVRRRRARITRIVNAQKRAEAQAKLAESIE